jgi:hypothetical protein
MWPYLQVLVPLCTVASCHSSFHAKQIDSRLFVRRGEALGNMFMVKAVELDIKLQKIANGNYTASCPARV